MHLAGVYTSVQEAMGVFDRIVAWLDRTPEVRDLPGAAELRPVRGEIQFDDVTFSYNPSPLSPDRGRRPWTASVSPSVRDNWRRWSAPAARARRPWPTWFHALRRPKGNDPARRRGRAQRDAAVAARPGRHGDAGHVSVPRHRSGQSALRSPRRDASGTGGGLPHRAHPRRH